MRRTLIFATVLMGIAIGVAREPSTARAERRAAENLDRGLIARPVDGGKVYLGWRLLADDPADVAFNVYRRTGDAAPVKLNGEPIRQTTDFVDGIAPAGAECAWSVRPVVEGRELAPSPEARATPGKAAPPYVSIQLDGDHTFQKVGIADLDGDGRYDFVIKQPKDNIDPWYKYWKPSPDTYKLEAYSADGRFLWRYDLGWSIERGIWYSPYVVFDLDGDGRAEVVAKTGEGDPRDPDGHVRTGPEFLTVFDGLTGKVLTQVAWPSREGFEGEHGYNYASRNQLGIAYLDGKTPSLIVERGTYNLVKLLAYRLRGGKLEEVWRWDNTGLPRTYSGQGAHWMHAADVDGDGHDEVVLGSAVVDDDGTALWSTGLGHPDHCYVGDIDPQRPGLEIYHGIERSQPKGNGMCLVDAATGKILWGIDRPTRHVHSQGMCSDITPEYPGSECYSAESDPSHGKRLAWALMHSAQGEIIGREEIGGFSPRAAHWDGDLQRELLVGSRLYDFGSDDTLVRVEGNLAAVADVLGDWREEIITSVAGELRIYTTTLPAADRRVCLMQDPIYRTDVAHAAMGYFQVPMLSYDVATEAQRTAEAKRKP